MTTDLLATLPRPFMEDLLVDIDKACVDAANQATKRFTSAVRHREEPHIRRGLVTDSLLRLAKLHKIAHCVVLSPAGGWSYIGLKIGGFIFTVHYQPPEGLSSSSMPYRLMPVHDPRQELLFNRAEFEPFRCYLLYGVARPAALQHAHLYMQPEALTGTNESPLDLMRHFATPVEATTETVSREEPKIRIRRNKRKGVAGA